MATRQYIGARYVPKFYDYNGSPNWRAGVEYENLTIVTRNGNSYTSKKPVPSNIGEPENNPEYWVATGLYNEQVEAYRQATLNVLSDIEGVKTDLDDFKADGAIGTDNIADGAITEDKVNNAFLTVIEKDYVTPEMFGAVGDGVTDDTNAWLLAINSGKIIYAKKTYLVRSTLQFSNDVLMTGYIINDESLTAIIIDDISEHNFVIDVKANNQSTLERVGVLIKNCYNCNFAISVSNFYTGLKLIGDGTRCCYNNFNTVFIVGSMYNIVITNASDGWVNENYFHNVRFLNQSASIYHDNAIGVYIRKGDSNRYTINAIVFADASMEGLYCAIDIEDTFDCSFNNIRTEGCTYALNDNTNTARNVFMVSFGTLNSILNGNNLITNNADVVYNAQNKLIATTGKIVNMANDQNYGTAIGIYNVSANGVFSPYMDHISVVDGQFTVSAFSLIGKMINVKANKTLIIKAVVSAPHRYFVIPFDSNNNFIEGANIHTNIYPWTYQTSGGKHYTIGTDVSADTVTYLVTMGENVDHAFVGVRMTSGVLSELSIYGSGDNYEMYNNDRLQLPRIPTSNGLYVGQRVYKNDGTVCWEWNGSSWVSIV